MYPHTPCGILSNHQSLITLPLMISQSLQWMESHPDSPVVADGVIIADILGELDPDSSGHSPHPKRLLSTRATSLPTVVRPTSCTACDNPRGKKCRRHSPSSARTRNARHSGPRSSDHSSRNHPPRFPRQVPARALADQPSPTTPLIDWLRSRVNKDPLIIQKS